MKVKLRRWCTRSLNILLKSFQYKKIVILGLFEKTYLLKIVILLLTKTPRESLCACPNSTSKSNDPIKRSLGKVGAQKQVSYADSWSFAEQQARWFKEGGHAYEKTVCGRLNSEVLAPAEVAMDADFRLDAGVAARVACGVRWRAVNVSSIQYRSWPSCTDSS